VRPAPGRAQRNAAPPGKKMRERPNIILIVADALRARNLGCYGNPRAHTPHIDGLASSGVLFERAYSCWNTTDQSLTSILTGKYPRTHGIIHHGDKVTADDRMTFARVGPPLLPEILRPLGYKTCAVDWMGRWFKRGFDFYGYRPEQRFPRNLCYSLFVLPRVHVRYMAAHIGLLGLYAKKRPSSLSSLADGFLGVMRTFRFSFALARVQDGAVVTGVAADWLRKTNRKEPYFLFLHYWDTHTPYFCPRSHAPRGKAHSSAREKLAARYRGAVSYVDHQIGRLLEELRDLGLMENTLVAFTSDHGESLTEHDILFDHHGLYEVTTHVPLILHFPRLFPAGRRIPGLVQHVDLLPTLLEIVGADEGESELDGLSLLPLIKKETTRLRDDVFFEESYVQRKIGLRTEDWKYLFAPDGTGHCLYCRKVHGGVEELYDLRRDPEEKVNLARQDRARARSMRERLEKKMRALDEKRMRKAKKSAGIPPFRPPEDPAEERRIRRRLRSLGYMDTPEDDP